MATVAGTLPDVTVKQEKQDDPEIMEMAAKIAEANRLKLAQTTGTAQPVRTLNGANNLRGYIMASVNGATPTVLKTAPSATAPAETEAIDEPSTKGLYSHS